MITRRHFLQSASAWSGLLAMGEAAAQSAADYKALVCVFLAGGNDSFNTVLATDASRWAAYTATRNQAPSPIALLPAGTAPDPSQALGSPAWLGGVLPITPSNVAASTTLALHPQLSRLQTLFNSDRRLAVVANVGPLIQPLTKTQYQQGIGKIPAKLYSHNDQQNTWQALAPEGATLGWGGRLVDTFVPAGQNAGLFGAISIAGNATWLSGDRVRQYQMSSGGAVSMGGSSVYGSTKVADALKRIASNNLAGTGATGTARSSHVLMADLGSISQRSVQAEGTVSTALATIPTTDTRVGPDTRLQYTNLSGTRVDNALAKQLQTVARVIAARSSLGAGRQVFFVQLGGFDTHDDQNRLHADLMARLDHALAYFDEALGALNARQLVTTFTASDFGRTFTSNGDGTDHGWGAHHFVLGGAVQGGKLYGTWPSLGPKNTANNQFDSSPDQLANGALLPTTSVDQYGATLGRWFGLSDSQLLSVFPNLGNFTQRNLGFV